MYDIPLLYRKLEDVQDALPDDETCEEADALLSLLIDDVKPCGDMVCRFCSEPFSDWFERTLHYDTCQSIARNRHRESSGHPPVHGVVSSPQGGHA